MPCFPESIEGSSGAVYGALNEWRKNTGLPTLPKVVLKPVAEIDYSYRRLERDSSYKNYSFHITFPPDPLPRGGIDIVIHTLEEPTNTPLNATKTGLVDYIGVDKHQVPGLGRAAVCALYDTMLNAGIQPVYDIGALLAPGKSMFAEIIDEARAIIPVGTIKLNSDEFTMLGSPPPPITK